MQGADRRTAAPGVRATHPVAVAVIALIVFALTHPSFELVADGLDPSWQTGLFLGLHHGLVFGRDVVYTYGPLGFLKFPAIYYPSLTLAAWWYVAAVRIVTAALLAIAAGRIWGSWLLAFLATLVGSLAIEHPRIWELGYAAPVTVLVCVWAALALDDGSERLSYRLIPVLGGALSAVELLSKVSIGLFVPSLFGYVIMVGGRRRNRDLLVFLAALIVAAPVCLAVVGQPVGAIGAYLQRSYQVAAAYSDTTGSPLRWRDWFYAACPLVLILYASIASARTSSPWRRFALPGLLALYTFQAYKAGLIVGGGHLPIYYTGMVGAWFGVPWQRVARRRLAASSLAAISLALTVSMIGVASDTSFRDMVSDQPLFSHWRAETFDRVRLLRSATTLQTEIDANRESLRREYAIAPELIAAIGERPVDVAPWEASAVWAYGLNWRPAPIFQAYLAQSTPLDEMNASAYASPVGPQVILRQVGAVPLGRNPSFESPAAVVAMVCHFEHVVGMGHWEVLRRRGNRCGAAEEIASSNLRHGDTIAVPQRPGSLVIAKIDGVRDGVLGRLRNTFFRARSRTITINGHTSQLVPDTAADGLLLRVPASADYPDAFRISLDATTLSVDDELHSRRPIRVVFVALPIAD